MENFISWCERNGWNLEMENRQYISPVIAEKESKISKKHGEFLRRINKCISPDACVWFLCNSNYDGTADCAFTWNEFELLCVEDAYDDEAKAIAIKFWKEHLPIVYSVRDYYSFYAVNSDGLVVCGSEPEFEEVEIVADSFEEFLEMVVDQEIAL